MPEVKVNIDEETGRVLKVLATLNSRSYSEFIPVYLATCIRNNLISIDPVTRELVPSITAPVQPSVPAANPADTITLSKLRQMGITSITFKKERGEITNARSKSTYI